MKNTVTLIALTSILGACTTYQYKPTEDMTRFYVDKLSCENLYTQGFNIWGNKVYGDIGKQGAARDCMLAKGYQSLD